LWCNNLEACGVWLISLQVPAKDFKKGCMALALIVDGLPIGSPQFDTTGLNLIYQSFLINRLILQEQS
jgi:hypothetical protein